MCVLIQCCYRAIVTNGDIIFYLLLPLWLFVDKCISLLKIHSLKVSILTLNNVISVLLYLKSFACVAKSLYFYLDP